MKSINNIALTYPDSSQDNRHFSFHIKQNLYSEESEFKQPAVILAISDIEGNFMALLNLLLVNKVIDKYFRWIFEEGHLVIVGDCFDRGEQVVECLWLIYSLEEKARKKGGYVHFILGNHEIMNLNGDWRYVHPRYAKSSRFPYNVLYNGNDELFKWLCTKNIIEKIGKILFVHGGIAGALLKHKLSVTEINTIARPWYSKIDQLPSDPILQTIFNGSDSPFWYRGFYQNKTTEEDIKYIMSYFAVETVVTGHTVVDGVTSFFNKSVINIDTDHTAGKSEALLIRNANFYKVNSKGKRQRVK